jgi:hypothetical protein
VSFARFSLLLVALFVSAFSLALSRSRADELPADTNTIKSLTPEQARKQARKLVTLSVEQARQLVERKSGYILSIDGLKSLDVDVAKVLARSQNNWLFLNGLKTIDAETAKSLAGYKGHLGLNDVISLDVDTIRALAEVERAGLFFDGMPTIDTEAAEAISRFRGGLLRLDGLTALDADTASVVARTKASTLALNKLRTIDPETAKSLLQFRGVFHFTALHETVGQETPLSVDVVKIVCLAANKAPYAVSLPGITAFDSLDSIAIAQSLAKRQGPLALPNLKKISPKTLTALIEKRDVEIPLVETLELIQEPDGSATEDFIIPEWLEERQRQSK